MSYRQFRKRPIAYQEKILGAYRAKLRGESVMAKARAKAAKAKAPRKGKRYRK